MIDWTRVNILRNEIGEEDFAEVIEMFLEEVEEVIGRLRKAPVEAEFENDLHFLKSSALNIGFSAFSKICNEGERNAAHKNFSSIKLVDLFDIYEISKTTFLGREKNVISLPVQEQRKSAVG